VPSGIWELDVGAASVTASVRADGGRPVAAISISGPSLRNKAEMFPTYGDLVKEAAGQVAATSEPDW
jgi:DNA-binding IclR family transcriptional regulator